MNWMILPYRRYAEFEGRSRRQEYWLFQLLNVVVYTVLTVVFLINVGLAVGTGAAMAPLAVLTLIVGCIWWLGSFIPTLAVTVRRFHDQNLSGWLVLILLIPYLGALVVFVFMCLPGTVGPNQFGDDPLAMGADAYPGHDGGYPPREDFVPDRSPFPAPPPPRRPDYDAVGGNDYAYDDNGPDTQPAGGGGSAQVRGLRLHGMTRSGHIVRFALDPNDPVLREGNFVIGRSTACNAVIADDSVSRSHAMCIFRGDQVLIRDLQSRNLTKINGVPLAPDRPRPLQAGDIVHFGEIEMVVAAA